MEVEMEDISEYIPPKVWKWEQENEEGRFAAINRPVAGATHEKEGNQMRHRADRRRTWVENPRGPFPAETSLLLDHLFAEIPLLVL